MLISSLSAEVLESQRDRSYEGGVSKCIIFRNVNRSILLGKAEKAFSYEAVLRTELIA